VELRELVALTPERASETAATLASDGSEAVCLSTCNRTELYVADVDAARAEERAVAALLNLGGLPAEDLMRTYRLRDEAAAVHLFRVAAGLDSLVPGEGEILGQVRTAYEHGSAGPVLGRLFAQALHVGKRARTHTAIGESPASVSSAAAALAQQEIGRASCRERV
jgi:glutamyl-tRNA reductase